MTRRMRRLGAAAAVWAVAAGAFAENPGTLLQVVLVSRHGVRTPTMSNEMLDGWAAQPWPAWKEPLGNLTARGKRLATLVGRYQRSALAAESLLPASGCPAPGAVRIYADVAERTEQTAQGFLEGLAPGCGIPVLSRAPAALDGVFHPVLAGVCRIDALDAQKAVLDRIDGSFTNLTATHRDAFATLQTILGCCTPAVCRAFGRPAKCRLEDVPSAFVGLANGQGVSLIGGLSMASTASELFLLEYADGKPLDEVGWGRAGLPEIRRVLPLHDATFDLLFRTPFLARRQGSSLLARVAGALTGLPAGGLHAPEAAVTDARLLFIAGHDDNLANLGGLLDARWSFPNRAYPDNETPPLGALRFEKRRAPGGGERIFVSFVAQTPDQMREETPLTAEAPPMRTPVRIPGCSLDEPGFPCPIAEFARVVAAALDPACVDRSPDVTATPGSPSDGTSAKPSGTPARSSRWDR